MDLIYQADIVVADLECPLQFGRQQTLKARLGSFDGNFQLALAVECLVNNAHSTFADFAHDLKAFLDNLSGLKRPGQLGELDPRFQEEAAHPGFPFRTFSNFAI